MKFVITDKHREKLAEATHSTGQIAKVAKIALGTGGMTGEDIRIPLGSETELKEEIVRKEYTASEKVTNFCYEYALVLEAGEHVGKKISEMALIDSDEDIIAILCFLPKTKDNIEETYRIRNHY